MLTLLGAMNGSVEKTFSVKNAERACDTLGGRLPTGTAYRINLNLNNIRDGAKKATYPYD